ncbi:MAG: DMT family transporter [Thermodesulfobacteriota bacterium]
MKGFFNRPYLLLTLTMLFWAGNAVLGRAVRAEVPPVGLAFCRWFFGFLFVLPFAVPHLRRDWPEVRRRWRVIVLLSFLGITCFNTMLYIGLHSTTAINAILIQSSMPVIIVIMSFLFFRETVTPIQALGILVSLIGMITIIARGDPSVLAELSLKRGDIWVFTAVFLYGAYSVLLRLRPQIHPASLLAVLFGAGTLMLAPFFIWEMNTGLILHFNRITLLAVGYVAIFPSILSYLFYNRGVELVGANQAGLFIHLIPVFGTILAVLLLSERFMAFQGVGIALILSGIYLVTRAK